MGDFPPRASFYRVPKMRQVNLSLRQLGSIWMELANKG